MKKSSATLLALGTPLSYSTRVQASQVLRVATWPYYHSMENIARFEKQTGIKIELKVFESNEDMLSTLINGTADFDIMVATNYTIETYANLGLIQELQESDFPEFRAKFQDKRMVKESYINGKLYSLPKNWGTTGFVYDSSKIKSQPNSWKDFWHLATNTASKKSVVHDYQLTAIGNALKKFGYSFNSINPNELLSAQELLLKARPHLKSISTGAIDEMNSGAWLSMAWTGDGLALSKSNPAIKYVIGKEGGEIWCDYYTIVKSTPNMKSAVAFINFLGRPENNLKEVMAHGYPPTDTRTYKILPDKLKNNRIMYPPQELLDTLEFGQAQTLTDPLRAEILNKFKGV